MHTVGTAPAILSSLVADRTLVLFLQSLLANLRFDPLFATHLLELTILLMLLHTLHQRRIHANAFSTVRPFWRLLYSVRGSPGSACR